MIRHPGFVVVPHGGFFTGFGDTMLHVVVVGGGPAGLVAAEALAREGVATTLIERAPDRTRPCAGVITSRLLEEFQIPEHLLTQRIEEVGVHAPSGRSAYLTLSGLAGREATEPGGTRTAGVMRRDLLVALLRTRAEEAGVTFVHGTFLRFAHGEGDYPLLVYREAASGEERELSAEVVIAADGGASRVAAAMGLKRLPLAVAYQERYSAPAAAPTTAAQVHLGRKVSSDLFGYLLPQGDQLVAGVTTELKYGKRMWDGTAELKKRLAIALEGAKSQHKEAFFYPTAMREKLTADRVLFVGDAAGLVCPATRDGLYFAMKSGRMAAETVIAHKNVPVPERLAEYGSAWAAEFGKLFAGQAKLISLFFLSDRRREALIDMAWDREAGRYAVEAFLAKKPFSPPFQAAMRIKAKLTTQLLRYNMMSPKRLEGETMVRSLPKSENYLELALKSRSGPLTPVAPPPSLAETAGQMGPAKPESTEP